MNSTDHIESTSFLGTYIAHYFGSVFHIDLNDEAKYNCEFGGPEAVSEWKTYIV
jgi:hypothetical protein